MLILLNPSVTETSEDFKALMNILGTYPNVEVQVHTIAGANQKIIEIYLLGDTSGLSLENIEALPGVDRVIRISSDFKILGRTDATKSFEFDYNGVHFSQDSLHIFAGLCAVDNKQNVELMLKALKEQKQVCTRMGAYKPRTSPYSFQGFGKSCLPYVFELAGKYGIKVIAMEVTHERHIEEIERELQNSGQATGVMLQIGTRNAQNFELLRTVGTQTQFPILYKRGFGISLNESLLAAEYLAHSNNQNIIFCLRGVKSIFGAPHRNLVDFGHVPVIHRLTRMPVGIDPSHSTGTLGRCPHGISDVYHVTAQGVISGANLVLVDFHPDPPRAVVDSRQAIPIRELEWFIKDVAIARQAYEKRKALAKKFSNNTLIE